jgi:hypothetical protein
LRVGRVCADRSFRFALLLGDGERKGWGEDVFGLPWQSWSKKACVCGVCSVCLRALAEWQLVRCDGPNVAPLARPPLVRRS